MQASLRAIRLAFFPPNTTSHLQPLDQEIINCLKVYYRSRMLTDVVSRMEETTNLPYVNVLEAINIISNVWHTLITSVTTSNCFRKAGFQTPTDMEPVDEPDARNVESQISTTLDPIFDSAASISQEECTDHSCDQ